MYESRIMERVNEKIKRLDEELKIEKIKLREFNGTVTSIEKSIRSIIRKQTDGAYGEGLQKVVDWTLERCEKFAANVGISTKSDVQLLNDLLLVIHYTLRDVDELMFTSSQMMGSEHVDTSEVTCKP